MVDTLLFDIKKHLVNSLWVVQWLSSKPNGQIIIQINIGQGSIRGMPKISITESI